MGILEEAWESTIRADDETMLIAALSSMQLRVEARETVQQLHPEVFANDIYGGIWKAARTLAEDNRLMLPDNFKPLLTKNEMRVFNQHYGQPVRLIELTTAAKLVADAAKRRQLIDGLKRIAGTAGSQEVYDKAMAAAHTVLNDLDTGEASTDAVKLDDALNELWEEIDAGPVDDETYGRLPSCHAKLNDSFLFGGYSPGSLTVIGAESGGGKSVDMLQHVSHWLDLFDKSIAIFSLEMSKKEVLNRLMSSAARVKIKDLSRRDLDPEQVETLQAVTDRIRGKNLRIFDSADMSMSDIWRECTLMKRTGGLDVAVIDYLQIVRPEDASRPRQEQVAETTRLAKVMTRSLELVTLTATQLNESERIGKGSVRESRAIVHHADNVFLLNHELNGMGEKTGMLDYIVAKCRSGPEGQLTMTWSPHVSRIEE